MNIFSCDYCGCVIDADKIDWPPPYESDGDTTDYKWNQIEWVPIRHCPCCYSAIEKPE